MINAVELQEKLTGDPQLIIKVLIELGFDEEHIVYHEQKGLITSRRPEDGADNPQGFLIYVDTTRYMFTTRSGSGNLFSLVMDMRDVTFPESLNLVAGWIGFKGSQNIQIIRPFGGFYRKLTPQDDILDTDLPVYSENNLPDVTAGVSKLFLDDNISLTVQEAFQDRFDHENNAILIPIRNSNGQLVGIKSRNNEKNPEDGRRYWASLPFQKTHVVYGLDKNYQNIIQKDTLIILEAEKGVQQAYSFDCKICVAIMGHSVSKVQARIIKSLMVRKIIVALDEGISEDEIREQCRQLQIDLPFFKNNVYYIYGGMPEGSKNSPTDCGREVFQKLIKENLKRFEWNEKQIND